MQYNKVFYKRLYSHKNYVINFSLHLIRTLKYITYMDGNNNVLYEVQYYM